MTWHYPYGPTVRYLRATWLDVPRERTIQTGVYETVPYAGASALGTVDLQVYRATAKGKFICRFIRERPFCRCLSGY